jgi:hypothetical protein
MGGVLSQSVPRSLSVALLLLLVACSGGSGGSGQRPKTTSPSTTAPPATIDLSKPIPGGSLHGTPRPPLENTGNDYVAITRSLIATFRWLTENPDPAVVSDIYVPGTEDHASWVAAFQDLVNRGWRAADDGYFVMSIEAVDTQQDVATMRVTDSMEFERIVDATGQPVGEGRAREPRVKTATALLSRDADGRWRLADYSANAGGTVQL